MNRTNLATGSDVNNAAFYQTAPFTAHPDRLVLVFVASATPIATTAANTPTLTGGGFTWEQVHSATTSATGGVKITCFRSMSNAPTSGTLVIDFAGQKQDCCTWSVFEYDGVPTTGTFGSDAVVQKADERATGQALSAPLDSPVAGGSQNHTVAGLVLDINRAVSAGSGFTQIDLQSPTGGGRTCVLQTQESSAPVQQSAWTWTGGASAAAIVLEIKAAIADTSGASFEDKLAQRFAPILFLHRDEKFVPVNAQRFVEQAAMWRATPPADDNDNWTNVIPTGGISTEPNDSGFLSALDNGRDCFLELGGWKDKSETAEPDVTATSGNFYANRAEIESAYQGLDPTMTPWYHAELIDPDEMKAVSRQGSAAPDYDELIERIGRNLPNPKLLNFYLFFPAHVQTIDTGKCDNVEAREVSCRAADWQCISLLLTGDGTDNPAAYTPTHIGLTGLRPEMVAVDGGFRYRAYAFDDDNVTVMKVVEWKPTAGPASGLPVTIDAHPELYVALGTHSLYLASTDAERLSPYRPDEWPDQCGRRDTPAPIPPKGDDDDLNPPNSLEDTLLLLAKIIGGLAVGGFPGFEAGMYAATEEDVMPYLFGSPIDTSIVPVDSPAPDTTSPTIDAITIRPEDVTVPNEGTTRPWASKQGHQQDGRTYDYVVDRDTQQWWPHADNEHGYFGRWGQQVAADPLGRRSGPHFPNYVRMFLEAFESALRSPTPDFTIGP